jgi:hypothetical protein
VGNAHLAPQPSQLGAGMIVDLALLTDTAPDLIGKSLAGLNAGSNVGEHGYLALETPKQALDPVADSQGARDIEQVCRLKNRSALGVPRKQAHIVGAAQRHAPVRIKKMAGLSGLLQALADLGMYGRRSQGEDQIPSSRKGGVSCQAE